MASIKKPTPNNNYFIILGGLCVVAVAGGSGLAMWTKSSKESARLPNELSVEALRAQAKEEPGPMFEKMRDTIRRDDLSEEQRRQVGRNMREVGRQMMQERVTEYFSAPTVDEKKAILDKQIDEFMTMRAEWEKRREEREKKGEGEDEQPEPPPGFAAPSQEERKARSESRSADEMAQVMAYFSAVEHRATERGIKMPGPSPGGPGGFGGPGRGGRGP